MSGDGFQFLFSKMLSNAISVVLMVTKAYMMECLDSLKWISFEKGREERSLIVHRYHNSSILLPHQLCMVYLC